MRDGKLVTALSLPYRDLVAVLEKQLPPIQKGIDAWDGDKPYCSISESSYWNLLQRVPAMEGKYKSDRRDCENFAAWTVTHIGDYYAGATEDGDPLLAHGIIYGMIPSGSLENICGHAEPWFLDTNGIFRIVMAQSKTILPASAVSHVRECFKLEIR